jgi:hypothetical protein
MYDIILIARSFLLGSARIVLPHVPLKVKRNALYFRKFGKIIPRTPESFLEKIQWRILNDRRELIARCGDKMVMKEHAATSCPSVRVPETLWSGEDLASVMDKDWGCEWVLKPITGSGYLAFGSGSLNTAGIDLDSVSKWRHEDQYKIQGEWAYGQAGRGYLIERKIETKDGTPPNDYRFFVFDGSVRLVQIDTPRFNGVQRRFYTPAWEPLNERQGGKPLAPITGKPDNLEKMLAISSEIGRDFDFVRVDLYDTKQGVFFGEITAYPTGGLAKFSNRSFDLELGAHWKLPDL